MGKLARRMVLLLLAALLTLLIFDSLLATPSGTESSNASPPLPSNNIGWVEWFKAWLGAGTIEFINFLSSVLNIIYLIIILALFIFSLWYGQKHRKRKLPMPSEPTPEPPALMDFPEMVAMDTRPPPRNPNFTGRTTILEDMHQILNTSSKVYVISGTGGMGKTQLAAQYFYQHED
jgi:hypothetical protein